MKNEECIFCKIAAGEIPSTTIYEDDQFRVFLDLYPASKGHALIIPKEHVQNIFELKPEKAGRLFALASEIARKLERDLDFDGMNLVQNNNEIAGQTVFHFHLHLIPRYKDKDDHINIKWKSLESTKEELEELAEKLRK